MSMNLAKEWAPEMNRGAGVGRTTQIRTLCGGSESKSKALHEKKGQFFSVREVEIVQLESS